jgi:iron-sulfur cluster repair protein YtfE (RIC family)
MTTLTDDAAAVTAVRRHHAHLAAELRVLVTRMLTDAASGDSFGVARRATLAFCTEQLLPHAAAEEQSLYPAAARSERAALLVDGMVAEHRVVGRLVEEIADDAEPVRAAAAAYALLVLFEAHLAKEDDLVLPVLQADREVSVAQLLAGMHELLGHG